jgi:hypothetical protein
MDVFILASLNKRALEQEQQGQGKKEEKEFGSHEFSEKEVIMNIFQPKELT